LTSDNSIFYKSITCGAGAVWTDRLDICLDVVETEYVILLCDDYLLCDQIDDEMISTLLHLADRFNVGNLRMLPSPTPPILFSEKDDLGEYPKFTQYRVTTQVGIWRSDFLRKFKGMHTNAWGFERLGSRMSNQFEDKLLCTLRQRFPFEDAVHKGKWDHGGIRLCERNNITIDFSKRKIMRNSDYLVKYGKGIIFDLAPNSVINVMNSFTKAKRAMRW